MKTAIIHDWIVTLGGAEQVLKELCFIYPNAEIFTLFCRKQSAVELGINVERVKTSFLQKIPFIEKNYRYLISLFPYAVESFDLSEYELIISSSHAFAKGVLTKSTQIHISYVHTPMRYVWELYHKYLSEKGLNSGLRGAFAKYILHKVRLWDLATANRPDFYIANSICVANRIRKIYGKDSLVIYPPVDIKSFEVCTKKEDFYLTAGRFVPYKRIDLIAEAFSNMPEKKLLVIGEGSEFKKIKSIARRNVEILPFQPQEKLKYYLQKAKAFVFAAEEDFGILPVEAQACGTPVIAYGKGGLTETVIDGKTGLFFMEQKVESIVDAVIRFERMEDAFDPFEIRKSTEKFSQERFRQEFKAFVKEKIV